MVGHEDVACQLEVAPLAHAAEGLNQTGEIGSGKWQAGSQQVAGDEEDSPGNEQAPQPRHEGIVAQGSLSSPAAFPGLWV